MGNHHETKLQFNNIQEEINEIQSKLEKISKGIHEMIINEREKVAVEKTWNYGFPQSWNYDFPQSWNYSFPQAWDYGFPH